ncbi:hypothetical protein Peur_001757 [Populus x canadensis]
MTIKKLQAVDFISVHTHAILSLNLALATIKKYCSPKLRCQDFVTDHGNLLLNESICEREIGGENDNEKWDQKVGPPITSVEQKSTGSGSCNVKQSEAFQKSQSPTHHFL